MKKRYTLFVLGIICTSTACKKKYTCYVKNEKDIPIDTVLCNCHEKTIKELEASMFKTDSASYPINCEK